MMIDLVVDRYSAAPVVGLSVQFTETPTGIDLPSTPRKRATAEYGVPETAGVNWVGWGKGQA